MLPPSSVLMCVRQGIDKVIQTGASNVVPQSQGSVEGNGTQSDTMKRAGTKTPHSGASVFFEVAWPKLDL
jgi:hypothetical protein